MASKIDKEKLRVAIEWISKLANGVNPIDDSSLSENDIVNNIHISRCLFYVADLLENIGTAKPKVRKQYELEFQLTQEERKRPRLHSQAGASPPRLSAARRESGSRCPWLGEAAPQPECCSVCAQKAPARPGLPWSCPAA